MDNLISELKDISNSKKLTFPEKFYFSTDRKTIMGEIPFKEILFLDYRDTEAGSNPREYIGLKKTNKVILQSMLAHDELFRFLHSGIIVSLTDTDISEEKQTITYSDCCLTNGNQTRFLILIVTLLKLFSPTQKQSNIDSNKYNMFIKSTFGDSTKILAILHRVNFSKISQVVAFLKDNTKYFNIFNKINKDKVKIEYRFGEVSDGADKVHILTLLRPIISTGILTKEKKIFEYTNQRGPIYKTFEKLLRDKEKADKTIKVISQLIPSLYTIRKTYVAPELDLQKKNFQREYIGKATAGELTDTIVAKQILSVKDEKEIEKIIKPHINYNIEHIFPVLIYRVRKLFNKSGTPEKIDFIVPEDKLPDFFRALIEAIYKKYIETKLGGLRSSLTTFARSKEFYEAGGETYIALKGIAN